MKKLLFLIVCFSMASNAHHQFRWDVAGMSFTGTKTELIDKAYAAVGKYGSLLDKELLQKIDLNNDSDITKLELSEFFDKKLSKTFK